MNKIKHLIVGYGEVGKALKKIIKNSHIFDKFNPQKNDKLQNYYDYIHICFPYNYHYGFQFYVWKKYCRKLIIVHSTCPVGYCDNFGVVHSPIRGVHPFLEKGIRTFVKYFGGKNAEMGAKIFRKFGIKCKVYKKASTTEALKIWDTTQYGLMIALNKFIYQWCKENKVDFNVVYNEANKSYNEGYIKLGRKEVVRPYLKYMEGKVGGHCVIPNLKFLEDNWIINNIKKYG